MLSLRVFSKFMPQTAVSLQRLHTTVRICSSVDSSDSSDSSDSDTENEAKTMKQSGKLTNYKQATIMLNSLLDDMSNKQREVSSERINVSIKPKSKRQARLQKDEDKKNASKDDITSIINYLTKAAGNVAEVIGGDKTKVQTELLEQAQQVIKKPETVPVDEKEIASMDMNKLLLTMRSSARDSEKYEPVTYKKQQWEHKYDDKLLLQRHMSIVDEITKEFDAVPKKEISKKVINARLNIWDSIPKESPNVPTLPTWELFEQRDLESLIARPPDNIFDEMIQWTKEGKLWRFPIDNEQGMEEEQSVHFSEHVFMERHLAGWCPKTGPVRHFMELVCIGLSKNAFMTVNEKIEHIMWYKEYFEEKRNLLVQLGTAGYAEPETKEIPE